MDTYNYHRMDAYVWKTQRTTKKQMERKDQAKQNIKKFKIDQRKKTADRKKWKKVVHKAETHQTL